MRWVGDGLFVEVLFSQAGLATQVLVRAGATYLLFDAGDGVIRDLLQRGVPPQRLTGVFLTHGHADHIAGLYGLLGYLRAEGHTGSFTVWYPRGACEVEELLAAFRHCYEATIPYVLVSSPLVDREKVLIGEVEVLARQVEHWHSIKGRPINPAPALGYRPSFHGQTVAITGDSAPCSALVELVQGADLALIEATLEENAPKEQRTHLHLTRAEAEALGLLARQAWFIHTPRQ